MGSVAPMTAAQPQNITDIALHRVVAATVRAEMARVNITQQRLAEMVGVSQQGISDRLRGKTPFTINEVGILAPLFGMIPAELIAGQRFGTLPPSGPLAQSAELRTFNP